MCVALQRHARLRTCLGRWLCVALYAQVYTAPLISFWRLRLETRSCHKVAQRWLYLFTNGSKETRGISGLLAPWAPEGNFAWLRFPKQRSLRNAQISRPPEAARSKFPAAGGGPEQFSKLLEMLNFQDFQSMLGNLVKPALVTQQQVQFTRTEDRGPQTEEGTGGGLKRRRGASNGGGAIVIRT